MSKGDPPGVKLVIPASGGFSGLKSLNLQAFVMVAAIIIIILFFTWTTGSAYLSTRSVSNLLRQTTIADILAVGIVFVIIFIKADLSAGPMIGLLGGVAAICDVWLGWPLPLTIIVTLALKLLLGAWNGWQVAYRRVSSFIVTLTSTLASHDISIGVTNGMTISPTSTAMSQARQSYLSANTGFIIGTLGSVVSVGWQRCGRIYRQALGLQSPASTAAVGRQALTVIIVLDTIWSLNDYRGIPTPVLLLTLLLLGGVFVAARTAFGQRTCIIGGSLEAARLSETSVERTKLAVFAVNGSTVATAELVPSSRLDAGSLSAGNITELDATVTCVIDDASLVDGMGSVARAVVGAFIVVSLGNGMGVMDVPAF